MADSASKIAPFFRDTTTLFQDAAVRDAHRVPEGLSAADLHTIATAVRRLANDPQAEQIRAALAGHAVYSALMSAPVATLDMSQVTPNDIAAMLEQVWHSEYYSTNAFASKASAVMDLGRAIDELEGPYLDARDARARYNLSTPSAPATNAVDALAPKRR